MNKFIQILLISVISVGVVGAMVWKANNPTHYKHPRMR